MRDNIVSIKKLCKSYMVRKNALSPKVEIKAVDNISLDIYKGEILGLIGESGSGKSTTGELVVSLLKSDKGLVEFNNLNMAAMEERKIRGLRKDIQIIFQYTQNTLDPKMTIEDIIKEPLKIHKIVPKKELNEEVHRLLGMVGLSSNEKYKYVNQLSGGQKQRIVIARAIATRPKFIVCDEPISALDVSIQGQVLNLLLDLKAELDLTYLFISHDLKVVKRICDRIAVMYKGEMVEINSSENIINNPQHEYTKSLIESML